VSELKVTVKHAGVSLKRAVTTGTRAGVLFADRPEVIAATVAGQQRDLSYKLLDGDEVESITIDSDDGRAILRHSTAHVLAQAVQSLFPDAKLGIGPPAADGFYYDFHVAEPFKPQDLEKIESRMRKIIKEGQRFSLAGWCDPPQSTANRNPERRTPAPQPAPDAAAGARRCHRSSRDWFGSRRSASAASQPGGLPCWSLSWATRPVRTRWPTFSPHEARSRWPSSRAAGNWFTSTRRTRRSPAPIWSSSRGIDFWVLASRTASRNHVP
jgi:hypothetical protein